MISHDRHYWGIGVRGSLFSSQLVVSWYLYKLLLCTDLVLQLKKQLFASGLQSVLGILPRKPSETVWDTWGVHGGSLIPQQRLRWRAVRHVLPSRTARLAPHLRSSWREKVIVCKAATPQSLGMSWVTVSPGGWKNGSWNSTIDAALIPSP